MVIAEMIGIPLADRARFLAWGRVILKLSYVLVGGAAAAQAYAENQVATDEIRSYLADLLAERRRAPGDDLLSRLVAAEVDGARLTEEEIVGFFRLLLLAGTEATTNAITNAVLCLQDNPEAWARLVAEPGLLPTAIEEVLRYRTPTQFVFRQTRREVELGGQVIPADKLVLAVVGAANRDEAQFAEPDRFDMARDPNPHVAFGHGMHFCIGAPLARLETRVALGDLLAHFVRLERTSAAPTVPSGCRCGSSGAERGRPPRRWHGRRARPLVPRVTARH
jgi:cytochrome P450